MLIWPEKKSIDLEVIQQIGLLLKSEYRVEKRNKTLLQSILLFVIGAGLIVYLSLQFSGATPVPVVINAIYWLIFLFVGVHAVAKSFMQYTQGHLLYLYTVVSPHALILAKIIYYFTLLILVGALNLLLFSLFLSLSYENLIMFAVVVASTAFGFSTILTLVSGIAAKADNNQMLVTVLSFPLLIPLIIQVVKLSGYALGGASWEVFLNTWYTLMAVSGIAMAMSVILFPFLWRS